MKRLTYTTKIDRHWMHMMSAEQRKDALKTIFQSAVAELSVKLVPDVKSWPIVLNFSKDQTDEDAGFSKQFKFEMTYEEKDELFKTIAKLASDLRMKKAFRDYDKLEGYDKSPWSEADPDYRLWKLLKAIEAIFPESRCLIPMEFDL